MSPACVDIQLQTTLFIPALYNLKVPSRFGEIFESMPDFGEP